MNRRAVEFIYNKSTHRPKRLQNNIFVLCTPERVQLRPGEVKKNQHETQTKTT